MVRVAVNVIVSPTLRAPVDVASEATDVINGVFASIVSVTSVPSALAAFPAASVAVTPVI